MATTSTTQSVEEALKCQTWVLKVSIHCQGCKRKVKKVLEAIDGVYTTTIDSQQQRVTVTGNVTAETLIKKLVIKTGKRAELLPGKLTTKERESGTTKSMQQQKDPNPRSGQHSNDNRTEKSSNSGDKGPNEETKNSSNSPGNCSAGEKSPAGENKASGTPVDGGLGASGGKKKKKKGQNDNSVNSTTGLGLGSSSSYGPGTASDNGPENHGVGHVGLNRVVGPSNHGTTTTRNHAVPWQSFYFPSSGYGMVHPSETPAPFNFFQASPYTCANSHQPTSSESFHIFSDENVNGCCVM